jgi:hypothetical protein
LREAAEAVKAAVAALLLLAETALLHLEVLVALEQHRQFPVAA